MLCSYVTSISVMLALVNMAPVIAFDGEHTLHALVMLFTFRNRADHELSDTEGTVIVPRARDDELGGRPVANGGDALPGRSAVSKGDLLISKTIVYACSALLALNLVLSVVREMQPT